MDANTATIDVPCDDKGKTISIDQIANTDTHERIAGQFTGDVTAGDLEKIFFEEKFHVMVKHRGETFTGIVENCEDGRFVLIRRIDAEPAEA